MVVIGLLHGPLGVTSMSTVEADLYPGVLDTGLHRQSTHACNSQRPMDYTR